MARARTPLTAVLALVVAAVVLRRLSPDFVPPPQAVARIELDQATGAVVAAGLAAVSAPQPALAARASDEDDEGFDVRILAVLALPLFAISWALFNVWRVAFRQVVRIGESAKDACLGTSPSPPKQVNLSIDLAVLSPDIVVVLVLAVVVTLFHRLYIYVGNIMRRYAPT
ncbi:unnamed protein product [Symbiodinium necroappetens]|uniref:Uncharacterized protein n=1 Tax=Symbiodinium necroappetens TaxID=1628268 RepID=A0A812WN65_9DINO|nr:unnamed protein product [Symbiodinium necroappetens]